MKQLDALRKVIREEVRKAIKDELTEVLQDAVKIASEPVSQQEIQGKPTTLSWTDQTTHLGHTPNSGINTNDPIQAMLEQTKKELQQGLTEGIRIDNTVGMEQPYVTTPNTMKTQAMASQLGMTGPQPGLDLSKLDFLGRATKVAKALDKKQ